MSLSPHLLNDLRSVLSPDQILTSPEDLLVNGYDGTWLERKPDVVIMAHRASDVAKVVRVARQHHRPVVPRGGGSGLAGGAVPGEGSIVVSTTRLNRIVELDPVDRVAVAQAGVVNATLQAAAEQVGLFYPPDPASLNQATIGGNVATSASGPRCLKYGGTKDYVVGLEVVLPSADVVRLGGRSLDPGTAYPLLQTFIGSEGTLGVVTEVTVRLISRPPARGTVMAAFEDLDAAGRAVGSVLGAGVIPLALEMMDQVTIRCVEGHLRAGLPVDAEAMLLIDVDGTAEEVNEQLGLVVETMQRAGAGLIQRAADLSEAQRLWQARRSTSSSFGRLRPNKLGEDISVPRSAIPAVVRAVQDIARRHDLLIPLFGHIGDGNLHPNILCDLRDPEEMTRVLLAAREIFATSLGHGGTLSGEHGIGVLKREFLPSGLDPGAIALMARIKAAFDPTDLLNPGKVLPDPAYQSATLPSCS